MERDFFPASQTLLETIKDLTQQFAESIAKTMEADVLIVDNNLNVVGKTGLYFRLYSRVEIQSVISQVLISQKRVIMKDRQELEVCRRCPSYSKCQIKGMIGVPVFYDGRAVGAIALLLPKLRVPDVSERVERTAGFLENMAELLAGGLRRREEYMAVRRWSLEQEQVFDCMDEGVAYTDNTGVVQYYNRAFSKMFGLEGNQKGENLLSLVPHRILREYLQNKTAIRNVRVFMERGSFQFYGFLSCREVSVWGGEKHLVFSFRSISNIWAAASAAGSGSMVTLEWARDWVLEEESIDRAKALAVADCPVLIQGSQASVCEMTARAICNYSDRSAMGMVNVYCCNIYRELLEQFLFSRFGELQRADHGTLILYDIDRLPLYLQSRLLEFLKTGVILSDGVEALRSDVRLIATTGKDLKEMAARGRFLEELYYRLAENSLKLPPIQSDRTRLAAMLDSGLEFYKSKLKKYQVSLSREAKLKLLNRSWGDDPGEIDQVIEWIVKEGEGIVTEKDLVAMGLYRSGAEGVSAISDMEKEKIEKLLHSGYSKVEIAKMLGIGRATLYRKMAEYGLK